MKISTIIPVYNASMYLAKCIDSLLISQVKEAENEIILVDDGSTDSSLELCLKYKERYSNIFVFSQENKGPSSARNLGLSKAKGEWITFVDSDDSVDKDYFSVISESLTENTELLLFNYFKVKENVKEKTNNKFIGEVLTDEILIDTYKNKDLFWFPVTKVYKRNLIEYHNIKFNPDIKIGEDTIFNLKYFYVCKRIRFIPQSLYNYVENPNSLTSPVYKENLLKNMESHFRERITLLETCKKNIYLQKLDISKYYIEHILFWLLSNIKWSDKKKECKIKELEETRNSIIFKECFASYKYNWTHIKKSILIKLFESKKYSLLQKIMNL
ncbi:glycosyltransferase [Weeksellaceae bacterium TAE3-ERU29]|nr:glycosyltransferase [Weeksellaceae bacterium TAE3-ERU29]